ncbi:TetR family transcriptional regulator [Saccharomonospora sp. CUA-673]|uniref:TetR/AcrR family transcriptional regulator n=1 Tax=Saccharomonospora sp. CUA-673 TaxID=1904969 RepID=UPI0009675C50|nr:TetR/AcrR family transcriptional regulator [Saccharomonospora sp. CUA-673]OLT40643.1 TetR family transcriptional regulator [Saccharomonospora sp. CUA-673]
MATGARAGTTGRRWAKTEETRKQVLDAAAAVFIEQGYTRTGVSEIVSRAGSSVGSVYHHFGGKAEVYLALWESYVGELAHAAADAVAKVRASGVEDPLAQFEAGTRAYLDATWRRRHLYSIFYSGDAPPEFETMRRERSQEWVRRNVMILGLGKNVEDRLSVASLTSVVGDAARITAGCRTAAQARRVAEHAVVLIRRLYPGPR